MGSHENDEDSRKLFVGGLPSHATKEDVEKYFGQFGAVEMCTIKTDVYSGRSRGFGFLVFESPDAVTAVLGEQQHEIEGKKVEAKLATPQSSKEPEKSSKVFVGGLDKGMTKDDITDAFSTRGTVVDVYLPIDRQSEEPKGFAFVTFDNSSIAETLYSEGKIVINGKECDVKRANNKNESRGGARGGFRGRGRGGYDSGFGGGGYGGAGYDQYAGYSQYQGGYGGGGYGGGYDQYGGGGGYDQSAGYGYGSGFDQSGGGSWAGGQDQYKMKGGRGRGGYTPY